MFHTIHELEMAIRDWLDEYRFYSKQSWVPPGVTDAGEKIHDVVVVGAGQSGLALTYSLKLRGVRRIVAVDAQKADQSGPWSTFARMTHLRTPKNVPGPECFNPLLSFRAWFCAAYTKEQYDQITFIATEHWREYLAWFRRMIDVDTRNETRVTSIRWNASESCLEVATERIGDAASKVLYTRRVCLATGITSAGRWSAPAELVRGLPESAYTGAWEDIPFGDLVGQDVAVIGAGASGFDNATAAIDAGCESVAIFSRSPFPRGDTFFDLWRGRNDTATFPNETGSPAADLLDPLVAYNANVSDDERLRILSSVFRAGRSPANSEYLSRVRQLDKMSVYEEEPVDRIEYLSESNRVAVHSKGNIHEFDKLIFATGVEPGLKHRPEFDAIRDHILTWADVVGDDRKLVLGLEAYPKLTSSFRLQPNSPENAFVSNIYSLADIVHTTVGLQSIPHVVTVVADDIGRSLFQAHGIESVALIVDRQESQ
ncbi:NAD(P)/FAD-dependent oxidoreductase [Rhodococcus sp. HNM0563]|uniref:FAD/NAD(P)-binding protein n=1 Tax=Rhodococcus sp. HNM0563 TaxID=2716339 RepID=UPI00146CBB3F|nr:FAD-dependent oxidoreductase [Rhodococcus sp. HNM0563]NLU63561.1 NAD(P)/FAD-dependent oxidoreductase [Rhodococcus sp. HNM0563]